MESSAAHAYEARALLHPALDFTTACAKYSQTCECLCGSAASACMSADRRLERATHSLPTPPRMHALAFAYVSSIATQNGAILPSRARHKAAIICLQDSAYNLVAAGVHRCGARTPCATIACSHARERHACTAKTASGRRYMNRASLQRRRYACSRCCAHTKISDPSLLYW